MHLDGKYTKTNLTFTNTAKHVLQRQVHYYIELKGAIQGHCCLGGLSRVPRKLGNGQVLDFSMHKAMPEEVEAMVIPGADLAGSVCPFSEN